MISGLMGSIILLLGIWFIWMNYKVDKEKEDFKVNPDCKIWGKKAEYLNCDFKEEGKKPSKLLLSGWWGKSRHMNYTYEIGLSGCWSAVGAPVGIAPFAYLGYIIALLVHRIYRDEDKCRVKYGKYWDEYCKKVRWRLIPGIY
jgi:7-dehydrocholesterol reductase